MFGGNKKPARPKRERKGNDLSQYGLFDVSANFNVDGGFKNDGLDDDDDGDLEAELAALAGGGGSGAKPKRAKAAVIPQVNLDTMVAASMQDIPSDEEVSGDDDDPDLLNELTEIAGGEAEPEAPTPSASVPTSSDSSDIGTLLNGRLKMYEEAERNAKEAGESSRARRFNRGIKTLKDLIKQAKAGKPINQDDIPPEVSTNLKKAPPPPSVSTDSPAETAQEDSAPIPDSPKEEDVKPPSPEAAQAPPEVNTELVAMLNERKMQYKIAALKAKKSGDTNTAISYIRIAKQFETVISAAQAGQAVDLSRMPGPPTQPEEQQKEENQVQTNDSVLPPQIPIDEGSPMPEENLITASSVAEALEQRIEVYRKQEQQAKEQENSSKVRRMGRIVKQYEQAIKAHKAGKPIAVDELPTPPGYAPIPVEGGAAAAEAPKAPVAPAQPAKPAAPSPPSASSSQSTRISGNQVPNSRAEKQLQLLLAKQKQFKEAALKAKKKGEIDQAKEFLRTAKRIDPLIEAASCGMPVDLTTLPVSPDAKSQLDNEYDIVMSEECTESNDANVDVLTRLETQLTKQLKMCLTTRDHNKALGDVAGTNRFERLALNVTKDLDLIRLARRTPGAGIPKFHYETKDFSIVKSFTELNENELELAILRGISYPCSNPKDIDTYVKFDFPWPQDEPFSQRTSTVKDTNSPEYNANYIIPIQRTARACQRVFKRHSVKLEVYSKGGFFRGDSLLGTATIKLQPLETQCELHESFDLYDGRKKIGGKLEVRLRVRHPIVMQQVEQIQEKWLIIDG